MCWVFLADKKLVCILAGVAQFIGVLFCIPERPEAADQIHPLLSLSNDNNKKANCSLFVSAGAQDNYISF